VIFEFTTNRYSDAAETMHSHINAIAGNTLLTAIRRGLKGIGYTSTPVKQEDWGWYIELEAGMPYMVGAVVFQNSDDSGGEDLPRECLVQVWREEPRKLLGLIGYRKEVHAPLDDPFVAILHNVILALDGVEHVRTSAE